MGLAGLQHHLGPSGWISTRQDRECCVWCSASVPWPVPDLFIPPPLGTILVGMVTSSGHVPWTAGLSNQSILKEINPEHSFEGLMLKF